MGLFFTLLYIFTAYMGPFTVWGDVAEYHIEIILACLAVIFSIPSLQGSGIPRTPQTPAVFGMCAAVFISTIFTGWFGGAPLALLDFVPAAFTFFFIMTNCKKKSHLQIAIVVLFAVCAFVIYQGSTALNAGHLDSPYLMGQGNDEGVRFSRLRGNAFINDPNDFAQLMVGLIPLMFFFWRPKKSFTNSVFVILPVLLLGYGMYLTHSRGGMIALLAVIMFAARRKIGIIPSVIVGGALFGVGLATGWSGGRDVSVEAGAGRMEAWAAGLDLLKTHPIFGVGYKRFAEYFPITAHNSVVVCAAEVGMVGFFVWIMFIIPSIRDAVVASTPREKEALADEDEPMPHMRGYVRRAAATLPLTQKLATPADSAPHSLMYGTGSHSAAAATPYFMNTPEPETDDAQAENDIHQMSRLLVLCFIGHFVAGWFLSRSYVMALYIYGGISAVLYRMALERGIVPPRMKMSRLMRLSALTSVGLIILVYLMLRVQHMLPN